MNKSGLDTVGNEPRVFHTVRTPETQAEGSIGQLLHHRVFSLLLPISLCAPVVKRGVLVDVLKWKAWPGHREALWHFRDVGTSCPEISAQVSAVAVQ